VVLGAPSSAFACAQGRAIARARFHIESVILAHTLAGPVESLQPVNAEPPNLREDMCGGHRKRKASEDEDDTAAIASMSSNAAYSVLPFALRTPCAKQNLLV